jgi:hypothetical protein
VFGRGGLETRDAKSDVRRARFYTVKRNSMKTNWETALVSDVHT